MSTQVSGADLMLSAISTADIIKLKKSATEKNFFPVKMVDFELMHVTFCYKACLCLRPLKT